MKISAIRAMLDKKPFRSFGIRTADGSVISVPHPDYVALTREGERDEVILVYRQNGGFDLIEASAVTKLEAAAKG